MKHIKLILIMIIVMISNHLFAQDSLSLNLPTFSKIEIRGSSRVTLTIGVPQSVSINRVDSVKSRISVQNGKLVISGNASNVKVTATEINEIEISGSGSVNATNTIAATNLLIDISGNGKLFAPLAANKVTIGISGNGKTNLSGTASTLDLDISGNGKINAENLIVGTVDANISGVGKGYVDVRDELKLNISGTGSVYYKTKPATIETRISGIGKYGPLSEVNENDTITIETGNTKVIISGDYDDDNYSSYEDNYYDEDDFVNDVTKMYNNRSTKAKSHWAGFEIGFNTLGFGKGLNTDLPNNYNFLELNSGESVLVNLNFFAHDFQLYKRYVMFTTGIGLTLNNYRFTTDQTLKTSGDTLGATFDFNESGNQIDYSKNKLAVNYITLPLLLQFNSHEDVRKSFHFAIGTLLNYKYNSHLKLVYNENGDKQKAKRQGEYYIQPFRADVTARIGYRNFTLFGTYALTDFFRSGRGPEMHQFQFGVNLIGW